jgi:integral membrane sensor domain MASE1
MIRRGSLKDALVLAALGGAYFVAGKLGLKLAFVHASATALWPCTGIALAAFLILGYRVWPAILTGAFLVNLTTAGSVATSIGIAVGNTLEGVVGCYLVSRFAGGQHAFKRVQDIFKFAFLAMASTTVSATVGLTSIPLGEFADWAKYGAIWSTWWLGDAVGAVVVTPFLLLWRENPRLDWTNKQIIELEFLFLGLFPTGWIVFGGLFHSVLKNYPLEYLCIPFPIWAAFRFGRRETATVVCVLGDCRLGHSERVWPIFKRVSKHICVVVASIRGHHGRIEPGFRFRSYGTQPLGRTGAADGGQRPAYRACQLPATSRRPRLRN